MKDIIKKLLREGLLDEELLDEVAWTNDKIIQFKQGYIPLTPSVVKKILGEPRTIEAFHVTDADKVWDIYKIIGKRNSISAFKQFAEYDLGTGIRTSGGVVLKISGILDMIASRDIMSTVDTSLSRRWVSSRILSERLYNELTDYFYDYNFDESMDSIRIYMNKVYELFDKYRDDIQKGLLELIFGDKAGGGWNELLVRNIKVLSLAWLPNNMVKSDETVEEYIDDFKQITPNITTCYNRQDLVEWYKNSGGYTKMADFQKDELNNHKREDMLKTGGGLLYLIKHDVEYVEKNFDTVKKFLVALHGDDIDIYFRHTNSSKESINLLLKAKGNEITDNDIHRMLSALPGLKCFDVSIYLLQNLGKERLTDFVIETIIVNNTCMDCNYLGIVKAVINAMGNSISKYILRFILKEGDERMDIIQFFYDQDFFSKLGYTKDDFLDLISSRKMSLMEIKKKLI